MKRDISFKRVRKIDAKWDNGSCTISKKESKSAAKAMKAYCKSKGYKFDRLLQMCPSLQKKLILQTSQLLKKQKKKARNKSKVKKEECFKSGFKYEKHKGECS